MIPQQLEQPPSDEQHTLISNHFAGSAGGLEKAGFGGSIPSLANTFSITYSFTFVASICSISFQNRIWACRKLDSTRSGSDGFCPRLSLRMVKLERRPDRTGALAITLSSSSCLPNDQSRPRHTCSLKSMFMAADANYVVESYANYLVSVRKKLWERFQKTRINARLSLVASINRSTSRPVRCLRSLSSPPGQASFFLLPGSCRRPVFPLFRRFIILSRVDPFGPPEKPANRAGGFGSIYKRVHFVESEAWRGRYAGCFAVFSICGDSNNGNLWDRLWFRWPCVEHP